jgi:phage baseplate assembly protein W
MVRNILMAIKILNYPFSFSRNTALTNITSVAATTDFKKVWQQRVLLVLGTRPGERLMRPDFGCNLHTVIFEPESTAGQIAKDSITQAFSIWLPSLTLRQISPSFNPASGTLIVSITYGLPNGETDSVTINTGIFNRSGDLLQEINNG